MTMTKVRGKPIFLENDVTKPSRVVTVLMGSVTNVAIILGILPMAIDKKELVMTFRLFSWTTFFSFIRLVAFNAPFTIVPLHSGL